MTETETARYIQLDFLSLFPGFAGGRALLKQRGIEYFRSLAHRSAQRPLRERQQAAQKARTTRKRRLYTEPRTRVFIELDERVTQRIIPYWPHQKEYRRRKRPLFVYIELSREKVSDDLSWLYKRIQGRVIKEASALSTCWEYHLPNQRSRRLKALT